MFLWPGKFVWMGVWLLRLFLRVEERSSDSYVDRECFFLFFRPETLFLGSIFDLFLVLLYFIF